MASKIQDKQGQRALKAFLDEGGTVTAIVRSTKLSEPTITAFLRSGSATQRTMDALEPFIKSLMRGEPLPEPAPEPEKVEQVEEVREEVEEVPEEVPEQVEPKRGKPFPIEIVERKPEAVQPEEAHHNAEECICIIMDALFDYAGSWRDIVDTHDGLRLMSIGDWDGAYECLHGSLETR